MKQKEIHTYARAKSGIAQVAIACVVLSQVQGPLALVPMVEAASSFRPTIFVNTEAFLVIDDDDTTANVVMRFGDTLAKTLSFNRALDRFEFNDDVYASGNLSGSGALFVEGNANIDGTTFAVTASSDDVSIGTTSTNTEVLIGTSKLNGNVVTIESSTSYSAVGLGVSVGGAGKISLNNGVSTDVVISADGDSYLSGGNVGINVGSPETRLEVAGAISGSFLYATQSFSGAGLSDCDTAGTSKLLWDATTGRFSCGTDQSATYTAGQGLSLNGTSFRLNATVTGSVIQAGNALASSGSLTWKGAGSGKSISVMQDSYFLGNLGVGTSATPDAKLEVAGTISGATIVQHGPSATNVFQGTVQIAPNGTTSTSTATPSTIDMGGTYADAVTSSKAKIKLYNDGTPANTFGLGVSAGQFSFFANAGANYAWYANTTQAMVLYNVGDLSILRHFTATGNVTAKNTLSGSALTVGSGNSHFLGNVGVGLGFANAPKSKLSVNGVMSGVTVYATKSFSGAGLSDCDTAGTSKLLWDATTGRFSCGTDTDTNTTYTAGQGLSLNGSSFRVNDTLTGSLAEFSTVSGAIVHAQSQLRASGSLVVDGAAIVNNNTISVYRNASPSLSLFTDGTSANIQSFSQPIALNPSGNNVGVGKVDARTKLDVAGAISGSFLYATQSFSGAGLSDCDDATNSKLLWDATTGRFSCGTDQTSGDDWGAGSFSIYDGSTSQTINQSDTITFADGTNIDVAVSGTDTVTIGINNAYLNDVNQYLNTSAAPSFDSVTANYATVNTTLNVTGSAFLGSDLNDNVTFYGDVNSNINPDSNNSYDFGNSSYWWNESWIYQMNSVGLNTSNATITGVSNCNGASALATDSSGSVYCDTDDTSSYYFNVSDGSTTETIDSGNSLTFADGTNINVVVSATDTVTVNLDNAYLNDINQYLNTSSSVTFGTLNVSGDLNAVSGTTYLNGNVNLGDNNSDTIAFNGLANTSIIPYSNNTYDIGNTSNRWATGYFNALNASDSGYFGGNLSTEGAFHLNPDNGDSYIEMRFGGSDRTRSFSYDNTIDDFTLGDSLYASGSLLATGTLSGASLYGLGLVDCDNATNSKLLWDATTGRFSCGTDQTGSASYTAGQGLSLNGTSFSLNTTITGSLVEFQTVSGAVVYAERQLSVSGSTILGEDSSDNLIVYSYSTFVADAEFQKNVSIGDSDTRSLLVASNVTFNTTDGPNGFFNVRGDNDSNLLYVNPATDRIGIGMSDPDTRLEVAGTMSGAKVFSQGLLASSGGLAVENTISNIAIFSNSASSVGSLRIFNSASGETDSDGFEIRTGLGLNEARLINHEDEGLYLGTNGLDRLTIDRTGNVSIGKSDPKTRLDVVGAISGSFIYAARSFSGAGLSDCDNATNSKLLWDATTGRFSCGTDQTGSASYTAGQGLSLNGTSFRVNSTLTGTLLKFTTLTGSLVSVQTLSGRTLNVSGTGSSPLLSTTLVKPAVRIGGSGSLVIEARSTDPGSAPANTASLFAQKVGGRTMLHQGSGSTFAASPLQNALFGNLIMALQPGGGTTVNGIGTTVTNDTTVSHPAAGETFGYMTNFATAATANDEAGTSSANVAFFRGSTGGANGFFYYARVGVVDTTSITVFSGMADQTVATMVGADNPTGNHAGFQFSTGRGDTNWQFETRDGTTQNVVNTGIAFTANKVYDLTFTCTKQCASITWEIRNVTDGTSATGTTSNNLPTASSALRIVLGVETETTAARNIRMQQLYVEADR